MSGGGPSRGAVIFGAIIQRYETVDSTQNVARNLARAGARPGTIVAAAFQTAGRGRRGRTWHAPLGANVCLTAIGPPVALADAWQIAFVAGLAACDAVREIAPALDARVRFPNDVIAGGRKLCGVLVETVGALTPLIGIGINVRAAPLPPEVAAIATSLEAETGAACEVAAVEAVLLRQLTLCWEEWTVGGFAATLARWRPLADPDARRVFVLNGRLASCRVCDIRDDGVALLETPTGAMCRMPAAAVILGEETAVAGTS